MTALPKKKLTVAEYLALEEKAEFKSEFWYGEMIPLHRDGPFAMAGASIPHNRVNENLSGEVYAALKGGSCQSFSRDLRVLVDPAGVYVYPDIVVVCGPLERPPSDRNTVTNPRIIMEVLSPSTEQQDRTTKLRQYLRLPTLQEYVLVSQARPEVLRLFRREGFWAFELLIEMAEVLALASIDARIPLADIYRGVEFSLPVTEV